ncbi:MAG: TIGR03936 family radical SAM-associated protein [Clostridia bacterium]|nr:TIGR03936 family radical SAM-associated protein [Clostridia bacterium]
MTRIVFSKTGYAKYISHLDLTRCMARIMARADIPIWYTQGFNPHPYMVFSAALPIGVCGERELLDIKLVNPPEYSLLLDRMIKNSPDGISFSEIYDSDYDFKYIEKAVYRLIVPSDVSEAFEEFVSSPVIPASKKTKSGEIKIDLKEEMQIKKTGEEKGGAVFEIIAPCGNERNISPTLLTGAFAEKTGNSTVFDIVRTAFLDGKSNIFR